MNETVKSSLSAQKPHESTSGKSRRDFIHVATGAFASLGGAALAWPLLAHMNPAGDTRGIVVDVSTIAKGGQLKVLWRGRPVFIRHRIQEDIEAARAVKLSELKHRETDEARLVPDTMGRKNPKFLVIIGLCTHFGCVPLGELGDFGGWYCPCHGAHFDTSGRTRKGPAPTNMDIPPYRWISETTIEILHHEHAVSLRL